MRWLRRIFGSHYERPEPDLYQLAVDTLRDKGTPHATALAEEIRYNATRPMTDEECLRMLSGAMFGPAVRLTLPSGKVISGAEAQVWTEFYDDRDPR